MSKMDSGMFVHSIQSVYQIEHSRTLNDITLADQIIRSSSLTCSLINLKFGMPSLEGLLISQMIIPCPNHNCFQTESRRDFKMRKEFTREDWLLSQSEQLKDGFLWIVSKQLKNSGDSSSSRVKKIKWDSLEKRESNCLWLSLKSPLYMISELHWILHSNGKERKEDESKPFYNVDFGPVPFSSWSFFSLFLFRPTRGTELFWTIKSVSGSSILKKREKERSEHETWGFACTTSWKEGREEKCSI